MTDWLKQFAEKLTASVDPSPKLEFRAGPPPSVVIAEAHPEVGELVIYEDDDEMTVCVGRIYHTHFYPVVAQPRDVCDVRTSIACDAAAFVADTLADRLFFAVHYDGDRVVSFERGAVGEETPSYPIQPFGEAMIPGEVRARAYRWSGPVDCLPPARKGTEQGE